MYASAIYPINDYRYYLSHHGIKGQKWGQRQVPWYPIEAYQAHLRRHGHRGNQWSSKKYMNYDGTLTEAGKARAKEDGTGFKTRMKIRAQGVGANVRDTFRSAKEAKGFINKASELVGHGAGETVSRNNAYMQKRLAEASRTKFGKHIHNVGAENAKNVADTESIIRDQTLGRRVLESIVPVTVLKTPLKTITGRKTTLATEYLTAFIGGAAGLVALEVAYRGIKPVRKSMDERYDRRAKDRSEMAKTSYENAEKERADYKQMKSEENATKVTSKQGGMFSDDYRFSESEKARLMDNAKNKDSYNIDFLEIVQNDRVLRKGGKELQKEYKKFLDNPNKYSETFEESEYSKNYKHTKREREVAAKVKREGYSSLTEAEKEIYANY